MKTCRKCETDKEDTDFRPKRRVCKDCERAHGREYRRTKKEKAQTWASENKERMKELQSNWYKANKTKINQKFKVRYHDTDSNFKKVKNYRTAINHMLGGTQKTNKYVGCKRSLLVEWMEYCLESDMIMENYGTTWTVDHVIPLDVVNTNENLFGMIAKWNNIMPVYAKFNLVKNKKIDRGQIENHLNNIRHFYDHKKLKRDEVYENYLQDTLLRETPKASDHHPPSEKENGEPG
jgi:hypothetical protein